MLIPFRLDAVQSYMKLFDIQPFKGCLRLLMNFLMSQTETCN